MAKRIKENQDVKATNNAILIRMAKLFPTFARFFAPGNAAVADATTSRKAVKPRLPMVNLLPPRLERERTKRATRRAFILTAGGILATSALLWGTQAAIIGVANASLATANQQVNASTALREKNKAVKEYFDAIQQHKDVIASHTTRKIDAVAVGAALRSALNGGTIDEFDISGLATSDSSTVTADILQQCGGVTDPFGNAGPAPIGCVTLRGVVRDHMAINKIQVALERNPLFSNVSVTEPTPIFQAGVTHLTGVMYNLTAVITAKAALHGNGGN
jgi:ABC-type multidrug transport system fused ATPase/permease subunit